MTIPRAAVVRLFGHLAAERPHPTTELHYHTPFELLTAVMLSAQSTDVGVNKATAKLFAVANNPQRIVALGLDGVKPLIASLGLYNNKSKYLVALSEQLIALHGGEVPDDRQGLEALPGVGRKTANVLLNILFDQPTLAVDTHIFRVANRTGLAPGKTPLAVEQGLLKIIPNDYLMHAHHWLILHGRYTCMARAPKCDRCVIRAECQWSNKLSNKLPNK
ncbi:MAG: endonuclease III [Mariprofundales bacterium]|nr:endonuclease III [Mariprofundales bacterium]